MASWTFAPPRPRAASLVGPLIVSLFVALLTACSSSGGVADVGSRDVGVADVAVDSKTDAPAKDSSSDSSSTDIQVGEGQFGDPCQLGDDCAAGHCLPTGRCSKPCTDRSDCPSALPWSCANGGSRPYCSCQPRGVELCDRVDDDCDGVPDNDAACGVGLVCVDGSCVCGGKTKDCGAPACTDITNDPANCGDCQQACPMPASSSATCANKTCGFVCLAGHADCDASASTGCEVNLGVDALHCGRCQRSCLGRVCGAGMCAPELLVDNIVTLKTLAVDATELYFLVHDEVRRLATATGGPDESFDLTTTPTDIVLDADNAYVASVDRIVALPRAGGAPVELVSGQVNVSGLVADATHLFWAAEPANELRKVAKSGGAVTVVSTGLTVFRAMTLNGQDLFWADGDKLKKMPLAGGAITTLQTAFAQSLAADATDVYWTDYNGQLWTAPIAGGASKLLISKPQSFGKLAMDTTHIYWPSVFEGKILRIAKAGGAEETLAAQQQLPSRVFVDATYVYWTNISSIWRTPK